MPIIKCQAKIGYLFFLIPDMVSGVKWRGDIF